MAKVRLDAVSKRFGSVQALSQSGLEVQDGEFLTILGPSGSGKTTLLRLIAGLEVPDSGRITIGERIVCSDAVWVPPQQRGIGMVFQHYALWPHLTAFDNVAFPLKMDGLAGPEITTRVQEVLNLVELADLGRKRPAEMSGGEQQRVALARALVARPAILLMDECLSNLDARLREKMAGELRRIQETVGITTIYVTHDQHEALALSDRIAVLHHGVLQQVGRPVELYRRPCNALVATSLGPINLLSVAQLQQFGYPIPLPQPLPDQAILGVRPEDVLVRPDKAGSFDPVNDQDSTGLRGRVTKITFVGNAHQCWIDLGAWTIQARLPLPTALLNRTSANLSPGDPAQVIIDPQAWIILDRDDSVIDLMSSLRLRSGQA
jgi:ABC-type sugar transport system ATPase subunit